MTTTNDLAATAEKRASLYWWFATIFAAEMSAQQIAVYSRPETGDYLDALAAEPDLQASVLKLQKAIAGLASMEDRQLELAADFAALFLTDDRSSASPYASVYLSEDGLMFQQPHEQMSRLLEANGLAVDSGFREPADHIAIELDYFGNLAMKTVAAKTGSAAKKTLSDQHAFVEQHLLSWVPEFSRRCQRISTKTRFYQACAGLLTKYLELDHAWLASVLRTDDNNADD